jgi:hypothetical protein
MPDGGKVQVTVDIVAPGGAAKANAALNEVGKGVARINKESREQQKQTEKVIKDSIKAIADFDLKEEQAKDRKKKAIANDFIATLKKVEAENNASATRSSSAWSSAFKGGFLGGFVGSLTRELYQIPAAMRGALDEAVKIAAERQNALKGLESIATFKGVDPDAAKNAVMNLRLVKAGIVEVNEATTGLKNLLATGFSLPEAIKLMEGFSDTAAFGKQAALGYGEAIRGATEGIKNQMSQLVDNAGVTKNLSVILKEAGKSEKDLMNVTTDASVRAALYNGLLKEMAGQTGDANKLTETYTGSTAALDMAYQNLEASVGRVIIQNPQMLEANRLLTEQLNGYTTTVNKAGSDTEKFVNNSLELYAKFKVGVIGTLGSIAATFGYVITGLATMTGRALEIIAYPIDEMASGITSLIDLASKKITDFINWASDQARAHPALSILFPGLGDIPHIDAAPQIGYEPFAFTKELDRASANLGKSTADLFHQAQRLQTEANNAMSQITAKRPGVSLMAQPDDYDAYIHGKLPFAAKPAPAGTPSPSTSGGTGKVRKAANTDPRDSGDIAQLAESLGFTHGTLSRANLNTGSLHSSGRALDISIHGKTDEQVAELIAALLKKGFRVVDEREKVPGVYQTGPHVHAEVNDRKESLIGWSPRLGYGNIPIGMLRELDAQRFSKARGGIDNEDITRFNSQNSDKLTKAQRDKELRGKYEDFKRLGWDPGSLLDDFTRLLVEDAKANKGPLLDRSLQPSRADVAAILQQAALGRRGSPIGTNDLAGVSSDITRRPNLDEDYIKNFREQLGIEEQMGELVFKRRNAEALISAELEAQAISRESTVEDLDREYQLTLRMNVAAEADVRARRQRNDLAAQYRDIQIELMNLGKDDEMVIEIAHLRDILDLRNRERDAVIATNRAQLELSKAMEISNNEIRAGVYEHMAAQKTLNQGIVDGINGTYDAILSRMNEPLDKLNQKSKGLLSFITEPLKAMNAQGLNRVLSPIMDKIFPGFEKAKDPVVGELKDHTRLLEQIARNTGGMPAGYNPTTGGISGVLSTIFNRGGGNGPGGTPYFNPGGHGPSFNPDDLDGLLGGGSSGGSISLTSGHETGQHGGGSQGGLGGMFGGLFSAKKNILTGKMSGLAGKMGGIGSIASMLGQFVPGRAGRALQYGGMGAQIGANFGPWGAAIGAAAGAIFGLFGHRDNATKKLKEAALSTYGVDIKSQSVLQQLNAIGEGSFGKGNVGSHASEIVSSEDAQQIIRNYALSTGQSTTQLDKANYGDVEWSGNQFTQKRGSSYSMSGGGSRAAIFTPTTNGSIFPSTSQVSTTSGGSGMDATLMASHTEAMHRVADVLEKFEILPFDHVVGTALRNNPDLAADAVQNSYDNDPRRTEGLSRSRGEFQ